MPRQELGEILLKADLITEPQLREALSLQNTFGERLASILVRQHILTEKFAVTYLGRQLGIPGVDLSKLEVDLALLEMLPLELCERKLVFPVKVEGRHLQVAMSDPTDQSLVSEIEFKTGVRLAPMVSLESSIKNAILEARRALRTGQKHIAPNVQRAREGNPGSNTLLPGQRSVVAPPPPAAAAVQFGDRPPLALAQIEERERSVFETLAGEAFRVEAREPIPPAPPAPAPPAAAAVAAPPVAAATPAAAGATETTVVIVETGDTIARALQQGLHGRRYRVTLARTGREAIAIAKQSKPALMIVEGMLADLTGYEVCRQLKANEGTRGIRVIIISAGHPGWRFGADVKRAYGADECVDQAFEATDMLRRIHMLVHDTPVPLAPISEAAARQQLKEGVGALKLSHHDEAIAAFGRGLTIDPNSDMLNYYLAMTYEKKDMPFHAIAHYERAIDLNPQFYDAITALATLYQRQEFWRKAVDLWEMAVMSTQDPSVKTRIKEHIHTLL